MGWGRYLLFGDLGQQLDLSDQEESLERMAESLNRMRDQATDAGLDLERLQKENDELKLYLAATIRLLVAKGVITDKEVKLLVDKIDSEDGYRDGRFTGKIV